MTAHWCDVVTHTPRQTRPGPSLHGIFAHHSAPQLQLQQLKPLQLLQLTTTTTYNYIYILQLHNYTYNYTIQLQLQLHLHLHQACFYSRVRSSFWPLSSTLAGELPLNPKVMSKIVPSSTTAGSFLHLHTWPVYQSLTLSALLLNLFKPLKSPITIG